MPSPHIKTLIRSTDATLEVSKRKRTVRAIWSTDEPDRYRTAFVQSGIDDSTFRTNGVICWEHGKDHNRGTLPIANAVEWGPERFKGKNAFIGSARFWEDAFADARFEDYAAGRLRGWSINVAPLRGSPPTSQERRERPDWSDCEMIYRSTRLLEVSATALPGNPSTLTIGVERRLGGVGLAAMPTTRFSAGCLSDLADFAATASGRRAIEAEYRRLCGVQRIAGGSLGRAALAVIRGVKDFSGATIEELKTEIERLKLLAELAGLQEKLEEKEAFAAQAAALEAGKAEFAATCK